MSIYLVAGIPYSDELYHHGIKGQRWGQRRFQNEDGSLTADGYRHYGVQPGGAPQLSSTNVASTKQLQTSSQSDDAQAKARKQARIKTGLKVGLALAGVGLAAYGGYKLSQISNNNSGPYNSDNVLSNVFGNDKIKTNNPIANHLNKIAKSAKNTKTSIGDRVRKTANSAGNTYRSAVSRVGQFGVKINEKQRQSTLDRFNRRAGFNAIKNARVRKQINAAFDAKQSRIIDKTTELKSSPIALAKYGKNAVSSGLSRVGNSPVGKAVSSGAKRVANDIIGKTGMNVVRSYTNKNGKRR